MEILTKKVTRIEEVTEDVVINLPEKVFCYQRWNYREIVKVIPITIEGSAIVGYHFIRVDKTGITHKQFWLSDIISLMRKDEVGRFYIESIVRNIIEEVDVDIKRNGDFLNTISEESFTEYFNGFLMSILEKTGIEQSKIGY